MTAGRERLIDAQPWGRVALSEGAEPGSAVVHTTIVATAGGDLTGALGLAQRWQRLDHPAILPTLSATASDDALNLRHTAPNGSTLAELITAYGPLSEAQCAALWSDLLSGVQRCHEQRLVLGGVHVDALFVCPPGVEGEAALRLHGAGLALLIAAARGGEAGGPAALGAASGVAPEVNAGRLPARTSDLWALGAAMAHCLLGGPVFAAQNPGLLLHAQREGVPPDVAQRLQRAAPTLAPALLQVLSPTPLLRAGGLDALAPACAALGGGRASVLPGAGGGGAILAANVSAGMGTAGGPWQLGSPLMALGAYVGATPYEQRFATQVALALRTEAAFVDTGDGGQVDEERSTEALDRARLDAALQRLSVQRALSQRAAVRKERTGLKVAVVLLTAAIAAAVVWFGTRPRAGVQLAPGQAPAAIRLRRAPPPRPVRSIPLFRKGDGPPEE